MRAAQAVGAVLFILGLATLYLLSGALIRLIVFVIEFIGIVIGFILVLAGLALIFGRSMWSGRMGRRRIRPLLLRTSSPKIDGSIFGSLADLSPNPKKD